MCIRDRNLFHQLHHGFVGHGIHRTPIAGDTTKLPFATGLTPLEKKLALAQHFLAQHLAGTQQLRQLMGHRQFGARVVYGDCLFWTISPNEQHSALVLRLSRGREHDPFVFHGSAFQRRLASRNFPLLESKRQKVEPESSSPKRWQTKQDDAAVVMEFPEYDLRRAATASDPLAVVEGYKVQILLRLSLIHI